ncbi:MAG TPA: Crp/Fnr family transcriptional regulator [Aquificales bacterium]|nr:Crp/Fnr family transcriptional regulator [Aquificales bacterium]
MVDTLEVLREIPFFKNLPENILKEIAEISITLHAKRGQTIFTKNSKATGFYILKEGVLKLYTVEPLSGREQIVKIVKPITLFGEAASLNEGYFPVNVEALEDSKILYIERKKLLQLAEKYPQICFNISSVLSERLYHLVNLVETLIIGGAIPRVAKYLLQQQRGGVVENFKTTLVANMLGLTPEAVSKSIGTLKARGIIKKDKKRIEILDLESLKDLVGEV